MADKITRTATGDASTPAGHYAHVMAWRDLVFVSGQLGVRSNGAYSAGESFEVQARQAHGNVLAVLAAAACGPEQVLRVTAYIVGGENWSIFNGVYAELNGEARPERTVVPIPELYHGNLLEVEAIAAR